MPDDGRVALVDDDESIRESLPPLLQSFGIPVQVFASAEEFLSVTQASDFSCLILDVGLPGMSGPQLQQHLAGEGVHVPVIFITARSLHEAGSQATSVISSKWLSKPFSSDEIVKAVHSAFATGKGG